MKIGLYDPYLSDVAGGGERHFLMIAECLAKDNQVEVVIPLKAPTLRNTNRLMRSFEKQFNLDLSRIKVVVGPFDARSSWRDRREFTSQYDIFYFMTDGSFFVPKAKLNIVHFQIPFENRPSFLQRVKLKVWQVKTSNSDFTKKYLERRWKIKIDHIHRGAIDYQVIKPLPKEKIILNVGRFISGQAGKHCKRQDLLVKVFKKMCDQGLRGWNLVLIGPIEKGPDNLAFAEKVDKLAEGYPIKIDHQVDFNKLKGVYGKAKIYWHAAGYGIDENETPQQVEHFGLTTIEAMAGGGVPIVIKKGGQKEIVTENKNGLFWNSQEELIEKTLRVMEGKKLWQKLSKNAQIKAKDYSKTNFCKMTRKIFKM